MILLEPRTLHQPEKLGNVSKNECVFTPSNFGVNQNCTSLSPLKSIECSPFTSRCRFLVQSAVKLSHAARRYPHFPCVGEIHRLLPARICTITAVWKSCHNSALAR